MKLTYRHSLDTINNTIAETGYSIKDCRSSAHSGNFQLLEYGMTCGVYFKKSDAIADLLKLIKG